jgi:DNA-binding PadR family transcriptional regulator
MVPKLNRLDAKAAEILSVRELLVLRAFEDGPLHGAEIHAVVVKLTWNEDIKPTAVYTTIKRLVRRKMLRHADREDAPGNAKIYAISDLGRAVLDSFRQTLTAP